LNVCEPFLGTDLVAELNVGADETVCLRADMDGLPVTEQTGVPYSSENKGRMHACGHDGHMAILVGAAGVLCALRGALKKNVRFVFQPGEEIRCAGKDLVAAGACEGTTAAFALHGWPGMPAGMVSSRPGVLMAAGGFYTVRVVGRGCHGAMPQNGHNPIPAAGRITDALLQAHTRVQAEYGAVISTCSVAGGTNFNVIPGEVVLRGTMRYLDENCVEALEQAIRDAIDAGLAGERGVTVDVRIERVYDMPVVNGSEAYATFRKAAEAALGPEMVRTVERPSMGCEDFAYFLKDRDGMMFRLGVGEDAPSLHASTFDFNDEALYNGVLMMALLALFYP